MKLESKDNVPISPIAKQKNMQYIIISISFLCILPLASVVAEMKLEETTLHWILFGKWFLFWASGIRLFIAGIWRVSDPEYIAIKVFRININENYAMIRELGIANIALGCMGILSLINEHWRLLAAITSAIFFGLMALQDFSRKSDTFNEYIVLVYDSTVFIVLVFFCVFIFQQLT